MDINLETPCTPGHMGIGVGCTTLEQLSAELLRLQKDARKNVTKMALTRAATLEVMEQKGYSREWMRLAKEVLSMHALRKSKQTQVDTGGEKSLKECSEKESVGENNKPWGVGDFLPEVKSLLNKHMLIVDSEIVDLVLAVTAAHQLPGVTAWTYIIGPSGSGKTEMLNLIRCVEGVEPVSEVTRKTFFSGLNMEDARGGVDPSFLNRHTNAILTFKDFTTMLSLRADDRTEIMGQLREVFDGQYAKSYGTGQETKWEGRITILAGVTSAIDDHHRIMSALGPRFMLFRFQQPSRKEVAKRARHQSKEKGWQLPIRQKIKHFLSTIPVGMVPEVGEEVGDAIDELADFVTWGRSVTKRNDGVLTGVVEMEMPSRLAQQFQALGQGVAVVRERMIVTMEDFHLLHRMGWETLPPNRAYVLSRLLDGPKSNPELREKTHSDSFIGDALEELKLLGLIETTATEAGYEGQAPWRLKPEFYTKLKLLSSL